MKEEIKRYLIQALYQVVGNKRYMHEVENLILRMDVKPEEIRSIQYLISDLRQLDLENKKLKSNRHRFF